MATSRAGTSNRLPVPNSTAFMPTALLLMKLRVALASALMPCTTEGVTGKPDFPAVRSNALTPWHSQKDDLSKLGRSTHHAGWLISPQ